MFGGVTNNVCTLVVLDLPPENSTEGHRNYFMGMILVSICFPKVQAVLKNCTPPHFPDLTDYYSFKDIVSPRLSS